MTDLYDPAQLYQVPVTGNIMPTRAGTRPLKKLKKGMGLYQVMYMKSKTPDNSKPWAVVNLQTGDVNGRWHSTREEALAQAKALYARLGDKAKVQSEVAHNAFFCFADTAVQSDNGLTYIEAIAPKTYMTPMYGEVPITRDKIENFISNFRNGVRGQDIATDYEHGMDPAKGRKASGWIRDVVQSPDGKLVVGVDLTDTAKQELKNKEWKYFSLEWDEEWMDNDGIIYTDVIKGGALTNRPVAKSLMPINFSEIFVEQSDYQFAQWTTAYMNNLPDSSFLYIESGGSKDKEGKTVPRSKRHFPVKDANGNYDIAHVRNAIARAPQSSLPDNVKSTIATQAKNILKRLGGNPQMSELVVEDESKEWEHMEPGRGLTPRTDEDGSDDPAIGGGWRRETPPIVNDPNDPLKDPDYPSNQFAENDVQYLQQCLQHMDAYIAGEPDAPDKQRAQDIRGRIAQLLGGEKADTGTQLSELMQDIEEMNLKPLKGGNKLFSDRELYELRDALGLDDSADGAKIIESIKMKFGELSQLRDAVSAAEQERIFAETYPQFWEEHNNLMKRDRDNTARQFAESVAKVRKAEGYGFKETRQGLSVAAMNKVAETHRKLSEGTATVEDFEETVKSITMGGIVQFGELGSSKDEDEVPVFDTDSAAGVAGARRAFAEVVAKIQKDNPDIGYLDAAAEAAKKHPDLADAYRVTLPA